MPYWVMHDTPSIFAHLSPDDDSPLTRPKPNASRREATASLVEHMVRAETAHERQGYNNVNSIAGDQEGSGILADANDAFVFCWSDITSRDRCLDDLRQIFQRNRTVNDEPENVLADRFVVYGSAKEEVGMAVDVPEKNSSNVIIKNEDDDESPRLICAAIRRITRYNGSDIDLNAVAVMQWTPDQYYYPMGWHLTTPLVQADRELLFTDIFRDHGLIKY